MPRRDTMRIRDILDAAGKIVSYTDGLDPESLAEDSLTLDAILRNLTVIGEAASHVSDDITVKYPHVPWADMCDMRNIVVHEYFGVDLPIVWKTIQEDIPKLIGQLDCLLRNEEEDNS